MYLNDGGIIGTNAQGTIEETGKHKWRLVGVAQTADGRNMAVEDDLILPPRHSQESRSSGAEGTCRGCGKKWREDNGAVVPINQGSAG